MKRIIYVIPWILMACGGPELGVESRSAFLASDADADECQDHDDCPDPSDAGDEKKAGGAGVDTSTTAAATNALAQAKEKACAASLATAAALPCPPSDSGGSCTAVRTSTSCEVKPEACPITGTFPQNPRSWVDACQRSAEPAAWKQAHCNMGGNRGGKDAYALCTVEAVATKTTVCKPSELIYCFEPVDPDMPVYLSVELEEAIDE